MLHSPLIAALLINMTITAKAADNKILACLGREEALLHKSRTNRPTYRLNQLLIGKLTKLGNVSVTPQAAREICRSSDSSPSTMLLKKLMVNGSQVFANSGTNSTTNTRSQSLMIDQLIEQTPRIFFNYILDLQSSAENPGCVEKQIPEIPHLLERYKHLEPHGPKLFLRQEIEKIKAVIDKTGRIKEILATCKKEFNKTRKYR